MGRKWPPEIITLEQIREHSLNLSVAASELRDLAQEMSRKGFTELYTENVKALDLGCKASLSSARIMQTWLKRKIEQITLDAEAQKLAAEAIALREELEKKLPPITPKKAKK